MSNRQLINAFKALSDDTRLRVLCLLSRRECCVCEVAQALEIPQPRASRCLTALYNAGLLKLRKDGAMSLYSIDRSGLGGLSSKLVDAVVDSLKSSETVTRDAQRLSQARRPGAGRSPAVELSPRPA